MRHAVLFPCAVAALAACGNHPAATGDATAPADASASAADASATDAATPATDAPACTSAAAILYLNRTGGAFKPGADDARAHTSSVLDKARTLAPWPYDDANWHAIVDCVTSHLAPFHIHVVDVDPGNLPHQELVFTATSWLDPNVPGVAPWQCGGTPDAIAFQFGATIGSKAADACADAMYDLGGMNAIETTLDCDDFMSYCGSNATRTWDDKAGSCGFQAAAPCLCGGSTSNSFARMTAIYGAACP